MHSYFKYNFPSPCEKQKNRSLKAPIDNTLRESSEYFKLQENIIEIIGRPITI